LAESVDFESVWQSDEQGVRWPGSRWKGTCRDAHEGSKLQPEMKCPSDFTLKILPQRSRTPQEEELRTTQNARRATAGPLMFVARRQHGRRKEHCKKREAVNRDGVASTVDSFPGCEQRGGGYAPDCSGL